MTDHHRTAMGRVGAGPIHNHKLYRHEEIGHDQARLIIVHPRKCTKHHPSAIHATLTTINFADLGTRFPFEALSYHWGTSEDLQPIYLHRGAQDSRLHVPDDLAPETAQAVSAVFDQQTYARLYVRPTVRDALYDLRHEDDYVVLWIDAICIDQENLAEKEHQVGRMWEIFSRSARVLVWLGAADATTQRAMSFVPELVNLNRFPDLVRDRARVEDWRALVRLMSKKWFSRRWVIQELALAPEAQVYCGRWNVTWDDFRDAISLFAREIEPVRSLFKQSSSHGHDYYTLGDVEVLHANMLVDTINNVFRKNQIDHVLEPIQGLEYLVSSLSHFGNTDPRDAIYSLLHLAKETCGKQASQLDSLTPKVDYEKTTLAVYTDFVKWVYIATKRIDIICRRWARPEIEEMKVLPRYPQLSTYPSWIQTVPMRFDLFSRSEAGLDEVSQAARRYHGDSFVDLPGQGPYNACNSVPAEVRFGRDQKPFSQNSPTMGDETAIHNYQKQLGASGVKSHANSLARVESTNESPTELKVKRKIRAAKLAQDQWEAHQLAFRALLDLPPDVNDGNCFSLVDGSRLRSQTAPVLDPIQGDLELDTERLLHLSRHGDDNSLFVRGLVVGTIRWTTDTIADGVIPHRVLEALRQDTSLTVPDKLWRGLVAERADGGRNPPAWYHRACRTIVEKHSPNGHINTREILASEESDVIKLYLKRVQAVVWNRLFFELDRTMDCDPASPEVNGHAGIGATKRGESEREKEKLHGFGPEATKQGDIVVIFFGCSVPCVLRPYGPPGQPPQCYNFIGESYVYGIMDGDALSHLSAEQREKQAMEFRVL